ncbi:MAG: leucine-rich repeat protein [Muribaculaceae bacterium]|nr:leucine-rich repeat protein [Muribaculaceae bacterium]
MKKLTLLFSVLMAWIAFSAQGDPVKVGNLYYEILDADAKTAEIVAPPSGTPYSGVQNGWFAKSVTIDGETYTVETVGEGAFEGATFSPYANSSGVATFYMIAVPMKVIKKDAFKDITGRSDGNMGIRFTTNVCTGNVTGASMLTEVEPGAFRGAHIRGFVATGGSGGYSHTTAFSNGPTGLYNTNTNTIISAPADMRADASMGSNGGYGGYATSVTFNSAALEVADYAFWGNTHIKTMTMNEGLTNIGKQAFYGMTALQTLNIPSTVTTLATDAFEGCTAIANLTCNVATPPAGVVFEDAVYERIRESGNITVPAESLDDYQADPNWGKFWAVPPTPTKYAITIDENIQNGTLAADKTEAEEGETVTLTATPSEGYQLKTITVNGVNTNVVAPVDENNQFTMPADDVIVTAEFEEIPPTAYSVTIDDGIQNGNVEADLAVAYEGQTVTLTATPAEGYQLKSITVTPETLELLVEVNDNSFIMPADNVIVTAEFEEIPPTKYAITIDENIQNGTVTADKEEAEEGEIVTLTVTPAEGYQLENITVTPETLDLEVIVDENYQFTMPADNVTVSATFSLIPPTMYTITIDENIENGTVTADKAEAEEGEIVTLTVTPAEGYQLENITVTPETLDLEVIVDENYQFTMPADNVTVSATFSEIPPVIVENAITFEAEIEHATIEVSVEGEAIESGELVAEGTEVIVTVTPENGYKVASVTVETVDTAEPDGPAGMPRRADVNVNGENNVYTFDMPGEPININVTMEQEVTTGIYDLNVNGNKGVKYVNVMGQVSDRPFNGVNIVIDGDKTYKVIK